MGWSKQHNLLRNQGHLGPQHISLYPVRLLGYCDRVPLEKAKDYGAAKGYCLAECGIIPVTLVPQKSLTRWLLDISLLRS